MDRARTARRLEGAVEDREILGLELRRSLDRLHLVDVFDDVLNLLRVIAEALEGRRHGIVDDLQ